MNQLRAHKALIEARPFTLEPKYVQSTYEAWQDLCVQAEKIQVPWTLEEIAAVRDDWVGHYKRVSDNFRIYEIAGFTVEDMDRFCMEVMVCMAFCDLYTAAIEKPCNETYANIKDPVMRCRLLIIHRLQIQYAWLAAPKNRGAFGLAVDREFRDYQQALGL